MATLKDTLLEQARTNLTNIESLTQPGTGPGIIGQVGGVLERYQKDLQDMINRILNQKGVITDEDYNAYYDTLRRTSKESVHKGFLRQNIGFILLVAALGTAIYFIAKKK